MVDPQQLRRDPDRPYVFKSPLKAKLMGFLDFWGVFFHGSEAPIDWNRVRRIAVLRLDHVGDVLLAFPVLTALERALPKSRIDLFVGPWSKDLVPLSGSKAGIQVFSAPWFERQGKPRPASVAVKELAERLREGDYDVAIDLRGDLRHIQAMKKAGIPVRIGQVRGGGVFWLTHPVAFRPGQHEVDRNLDLLAQMGLGTGASDREPHLHFGREQEEEAQKTMDGLGLKGPFIVLHATCLASAKRWPEDRWRELVAGMPEDTEWVVIGAGGEQADAERIFGPVARKVVLATGKFSLPALAAFLKKARLFIGVDSAPAHLAAAVGTPVVSLFSGTNKAAQWAPRGPRVTVLQKSPACSPCELLECPVGHECMEGIGVPEVLELARKKLS